MPRSASAAPPWRRARRHLPGSGSGSPTSRGRTVRSRSAPACGACRQPDPATTRSPGQRPRPDCSARGSSRPTASRAPAAVRAGRPFAGRFGCRRTALPACATPWGTTRASSSRAAARPARRTGRARRRASSCCRSAARGHRDRPARPRSRRRPGWCGSSPRRRRRPAGKAPPHLRAAHRSKLRARPRCRRGRLVLAARALPGTARRAVRLRASRTGTSGEALRGRKVRTWSSTHLNVFAGAGIPTRSLQLQISVHEHHGHGPFADRRRHSLG